MELEEIRSMIQVAVDEARAAGLSIKPGGFGVTYDDRWTCSGDCVCPLGALLLSRQPPKDGACNAVNLTLDVPSGWATSFAHAFDYGPQSDFAYTVSSAGAMGLEFRKSLLP